MGLFGQQQVPCAAGVPTSVIRSLWTNVPKGFVIELDPPDVSGTWVERRSALPAGIALSERASGPLAAEVRFRRRYLDSSYEVEVTTDRPATVRVASG